MLPLLQINSLIIISMLKDLKIKIMTKAKCVDCQILNRIS